MELDSNIIHCKSFSLGICYDQLSHLFGGGLFALGALLGVAGSNSGGYLKNYMTVYLGFVGGLGLFPDQEITLEVNMYRCAHVPITNALDVIVQPPRQAKYLVQRAYMGRTLNSIDCFLGIEPGFILTTFESSYFICK